MSLYADSIYAYVRSRLIPRMDVVEDIVQEVFLAAFDNLKQFQGTSSLRGWLLGIARHKVEDYYRRRFRDPEPDSADAAEILSFALEEPSLEESIDRCHVVRGFEADCSLRFMENPSFRL